MRKPGKNTKVRRKNKQLAGDTDPGPSKDSPIMNVGVDPLVKPGEDPDERFNDGKPPKIL